MSASREAARKPADKPALNQLARTAAQLPTLFRRTARHASGGLRPEATSATAFCAIDCPGRCPLRFTLRDGEVATVTADKRAAACQRGRAMRAWMNSPDRLMWPMKRTGPRGSAQFERVSWDEALDIAARELSRIIRDYGNEAVYLHYATGQSCTTEKPFGRLLNCLGGHLSYYNNYSNPQINAMTQYLYGPVAVGGGSEMAAAADAQLVLAFGANTAQTGGGGAAPAGQWAHVRAAVKRAGGRIFVVDPRMSASVGRDRDSWIPINPGTDAALATALVHELIVLDACDREFLHAHCVGFDEDTMPAAYRGKALSYTDYVMGTGYDRIEKTPEWAAEITGVPADRIRTLARDLAEARPAFIMQGWGPQRRSNGEMSSGAIMALALAIGQVGLPGTNPGGNVAWGGGGLSGMPAGTNRVRTWIPSFLFTDAVDDGPSLTAADGVLGRPRLRTGIKCLITHAGNCLTNQHGNINRAHAILSDPAKCEFILDVEVAFNDSCRYADLVLPDLFRAEEPSIVDGGYGGAYVVASNGEVGARFERRGAWNVCREIARRLDVEDAFTGGMSEREWIRRLYKGDRERDPELPPYDQLMEEGAWFRGRELGDPREPQTDAREHAAGAVVLADWRRDPAAFPLSTPSGKAELFSEQLARIAERLVGAADEGAVTPVPTYVPEWDAREVADWRGAGAPNSSHAAGSSNAPEPMHPVASDKRRAARRFPLRVFGFHGPARIHSSWGNVRPLQQRYPQQLWINPADAEQRGLLDGDAVIVSSPFGALRIHVRVTDRIIAGTVALPQGAWYRPANNPAATSGVATIPAAADPDARRDPARNAAAPAPLDVGGSINVLTGSRPSPLAKGNPQHTCWCEVEKAGKH